MKISLNEALKFTLKWEGNYSNHPADKGGPTNRGIIQSQYDKYRDEKKHAETFSAIYHKLRSFRDL